MTVSDQTNRTSVVGDGTTQEIPFSFPASATSDIEVRSRVITTGVESDPLTENSDYTVSLSGDSGGTVTMITTFADTYQIHVKRNTPKTQLLDLEQGGSFNAENIEDALDKNTKLSIENADSLDRTLRFPETDADSIMEELPKASTRAGKFLYFGADGNPSVAESITTGETIISTFGKELIDDDNASAALTTLGFTPFGKSLIDDADASAVLDTLGFSDLGKNLIDDATAAAARTTLEITSANVMSVINVKDPPYNAVGNGVADDTAALQAAIDAATIYGTVVLPPGTYKFSQLKFYNPIVFTGLGSVAGRWNSTEAAVKLLHDESENPAIIVGGTADSDITTGAYYIAEGITLANFLLYPTGSTANVGILVDGSTTIYGNRGPARGIRFDNVVGRDFGSNNIKFLGGAFDIVFKGGGSFARYATGIYGLAADYHTGGTSTPSQIHFYDFYSTAATGDWNYDGQFKLYGGGTAYGNGFLARSRSAIYGTHFEGWSADPASIGLQIVGQYGIFEPGVIASHDTAIKIGDGTATVARNYFINTTINAATVGVEITDGGVRNGTGIIYFSGDVTTDIQDDRAGTDNIYNSLKILNDTRRIETIKTLDNTGTPTVGDVMASGGIFLTGGTTTITDFDDGYAGQVITIIAEHSLDITDGTNIFLSGSTTWSMTATDTLTLICKADNKWYEISRSDSGA